MISPDQMSEGDDLEDDLLFRRLEGIIFAIALTYPSKLEDLVNILVFWYHQKLGSYQSILLKVHKLTVKIKPFILANFYGVTLHLRLFSTRIIFTIPVS